jgi:hypothetical protein
VNKVVGKTLDGRLILEDADGNVRPESDAEVERKRARFADLLAARQSPKTRGLDRSFCEGRNGYDDGLDAMNRERFYRAAKRAGVSTSGKFYVHGLADYLYDPNGWVSDLGEVVAKCKAQGRSCEGSATYNAPEGPPQQAVRLSEELIEEELTARLIEDPDLKAHPERWAEEREKIIEQHGSPVGDMHNVAGCS